MTCEAKHSFNVFIVNTYRTNLVKLVNEELLVALSMPQRRQNPREVIVQVSSGFVHNPEKPRRPLQLRPYRLNVAEVASVTFFTDELSRSIED
jgi:hypothetical protein